jgi:hypothetical protein
VSESSPLFEPSGHLKGFAHYPHSGAGERNFKRSVLHCDGRYLHCNCRAALLASYLFTSNELLGVAGAFLALYGLAVAAAPVYLEAYVFNRFKRTTRPMPASAGAKGLSKGACYATLGGLSVSLVGAALLATYFLLRSKHVARG